MNTVYQLARDLLQGPLRLAIRVDEAGNAYVLIEGVFEPVFLGNGLNIEFKLAAAPPASYPTLLIIERPPK